MGEVYEAFLLSEGGVRKKVAAKKVLDNRSESEILREARSSIGLSHKNISTVYALMKHEDALYLVQEFIEGLSLASLIQKLKEHKRPLTNQELTAILYQALQAIDYLNSRKIIHRDISPSNLMISTDGLLKFIDFGISIQSSYTLQDQIKGKLSYLSAESLKGDVSPTSDLYSLGLTIYELATLGRVFESESFERVLSKKTSFQVLSLQLVRKDLDKRLCRIVDELINDYKRINLKKIQDKIFEIHKADSERVLKDLMADLSLRSPKNLGTYTESRDEIYLQKRSHGVTIALSVAAFLTVFAVIAFFLLKEEPEVYIQTGSYIKPLKFSDIDQLGAEDVKVDTFMNPTCLNLCYESLLSYQALSDFDKLAGVRNTIKTYRRWAEINLNAEDERSKYYEFLDQKCSYFSRCQEIKKLREALNLEANTLLEENKLHKLRSNFFNLNEYYEKLIKSIPESEFYLAKYLISFPRLMQAKYSRLSKVYKHDLIEIHPDVVIDSGAACRFVVEVTLALRNVGSTNSLQSDDFSVVVVKSDQISNTSGNPHSTILQVYNRDVKSIDVCLTEMRKGMVVKSQFIRKDL